MTDRAIGVIGWAAFLLIAAPGHARISPAPKPAPTPAVTLPEGVGSMMQITVKRRPASSDAEFAARAKAFAATTRSITSCEQANAYAIAARAEMTITLTGRFADVPAPLAQLLRSRSLGYPSPPFGLRATGVRILILCPTTFRVTPPSGRRSGRDI